MARMARLLKDVPGVMPTPMTDHEIIVTLAKLGSELSYEDDKIVLNIKSIGLITKFEPCDNILQDGFRPLITLYEAGLMDEATNEKNTPT
jgi:hypothetical protein